MDLRIFDNIITNTIYMLFQETEKQSVYLLKKYPRNVSGSILTFSYIYFAKHLRMVHLIYDLSLEAVNSNV